MSKHLLFVVDDSEDDQALTLRAIKRAGQSCVVSVAQDGEVAAQALGLVSGPFQAPLVPDLILLDIKMPKVSGLELLRMIREEERTRNLPVVVFTSSSEDFEIENVQQLGAVYERKPIDYLDYVGTVERIIRQRLIEAGTFFT